MELSDPAAPSRIALARAFLPFRIAVGISIVLLCAAYHLRHAARTQVMAKVLVDGEPVRGFGISVDGGEFLGSEVPIPIGWHDLAFVARDAIPDNRPCFIWYGSNSLGTIDLERVRGKVQLEVSPPPERLWVHGQHGTFGFPRGFLSNLPVGDYDVDFDYGREFSNSIRVKVVAGVITTNSVKNPIGRFEILGASPEAEVVIESTTDDHKYSGRLPFVVRYAPSGEYRLRVTRRDYLFERTLLLRPAETNTVKVEFVYGGLEITSDPPGAKVHIRGVDSGATPLRRSNVIPGSYLVEITKDGYHPEHMDLSVEGTNVVHVHRVLENIAFRQGMDDFKRARDAGRFRDAVGFLEAALRAKPSDSEASSVLPKTKTAAFREEAEEWILRRDVAKASHALDMAEAVVPDDPATKVLQGRITGLKSEIEQEAVAARDHRLEEERRKAIEAGRRAREAAQAAIEAERFDRARESIAEARRSVPNDPDLQVLEGTLRNAEAVFEARVAKEKLEERARTRRQEFRGALERAVRDEEHRPVRTLTWRTTKSARQVAFACEPKEGKGMDVYDLYTSGDYLITWRNGRLLPIIGTGVYIRFGAVTLAPGQTEVHAMLYSLTLGREGRPVSDTNDERNMARATTINDTLKKALDGDLELLSP